MVWFVRHAGVELRLDVPAAQWELSAEGREAAQALAVRLAPVPRLLASPEPKALDTGRPLAAASGVEIEVDERLREVERASNLPTYDEHRAAVARYLGYDAERWERIALPDVIEWRP